MFDSEAEFVALRRAAFRGRYELDALLSEVGRARPESAFLANPAAQYPYLYLTAYVRRFCEAWFRRPVGDVSILDWGCGKGHVSYLLGRTGAKVTSADVAGRKTDSSFGQSVPIIERAGIDVVPLEHPWRLPFADASFDVALSFGVLEHVPDDAASMGELARVLGPRGLFFCFDLPYRLSWTQNLAHLRGDRYHDRLYRRGHTRRLVEAKGLRVVDAWHRQLLPKNRVRYPAFRVVEALDQLATELTPLKFFATNIELVATKL